MNICIILIMVVLMLIVYLKGAIIFCIKQLGIQAMLLTLLIATMLMAWQKKQPWFNIECKMLRKEYHRSKNYNRHQKTAESKLNMVRASRAYKKAISKQFKSYQDSVVKKLRGLLTTNLKAYWSIINRSGETKKILNDITVNTFYDHFKNLDQEQESDYPDIPVEQITRIIQS